MNLERPLADSDILELIKQSVAVVTRDIKTQPGPVTLDSSLSALGIDSMSAIEVGADLEEKLKVRFPDDQLARVTTMRDLVALIRRNLN
jgi:acyl carrier protein